MSNEEIIEKVLHKRIFNFLFSGSIELKHKEINAALDAARKDEAIAFNRWRDGQGWDCELHDDEDVKHWQKYGEGKPYTDEELYHLFKQQYNG